jgi:uncharacterized protein (TIGR00299 family) protein
MKTAYFDLISGASGDMILGALVDSGLPIEKLKRGLEALKLDGFSLRAQAVNKNGFHATKVHVVVKDDVPHRHLPEINAIIHQSDLPSKIKEQAVTIFNRLGSVEAGIHGTSMTEVHLHELGGTDTIVDVVGTLLGLEEIGIQEVISSPVPLGRGFIQGAHGIIPLPAPATLELLKGIPILGVDLQVETVTPTGAVLLTTLAHKFGPIPRMHLESVGYGAGGRDLPIPNIVRVLIGQDAVTNPESLDSLVVLETNIDDLNPETYAYVMERLFLAGALDVYLTPIQMKKNRPATLLQALALPEDTDKLRRIIFEETSTLGIRQQRVERYALHRYIRRVETPFGLIRVKVADLGPGKTKRVPEFEDCRSAAQEYGVPLWEVYQAAQVAAQSERLKPDFHSSQP